MPSTHKQQKKKTNPTATNLPAPFWRCEKNPVAASRNRVLARNRRPATRLSDTGSGRKPDFCWQLASHLPHEAKVEQIFSLGGRVSDPNINPDYLATLVFVGSNYKVYMPPKKDIYQRYLCKFTKGGKLLEAELGLA